MAGVSRAPAAALALLLAASGAACGPGLPPESRALPEWLANDPQRCLIPRDLSQKLETHARRCAERFLAENGYTESIIAIDTARIVAERGERAVTPAVLEQRFATLAPEASMVQCSGGDCFIFFELRDRSRPCRLRAVLMTWVFTRMRLRPGTVVDHRCSAPVRA
jgi:hypothetical protein